MADQPFLAEETPFPPGAKDFDFHSLIPSLRGSEWGYAITKLSVMVWLAVAILIIFFLVAYRKPKLVGNPQPAVQQPTDPSPDENPAEECAERRPTSIGPGIGLLWRLLVRHDDARISAGLRGL